MISITKQNGELEINTPYNRDFVYDLKRDIPASDRAWDGRQWVVLDHHEQKVSDIIYINYGVRPSVTVSRNITSSPSVQFIKLEYLGRCKDKSPDEPMASGWVNGSWSFLFRESALRSFFLGTEPPNESKYTQKPQEDTHYSVLGITRSSTQDDVKKAYRRMAKQWHPDVNRGDPDAAAMFIKINDANAKLSDPIQRKKYDFILRLIEEDLKSKPKTDLGAMIDSYYDNAYGYRSSLRCGLLVCDCGKRLGRFVVTKIHSWDDITDHQGKTMVSSWAAGDKMFSVHWV